MQIPSNTSFSNAQSRISRRERLNTRPIPSHRNVQNSHILQQNRRCLNNNNNIIIVAKQTAEKFGDYSRLAGDYRERQVHYNRPQRSQNRSRRSRLIASERERRPNQHGLSDKEQQRSSIRYWVYSNGCWTISSRY